MSLSLNSTSTHYLTFHFVYFQNERQSDISGMRESLIFQTLSTQIEKQPVYKENFSCRMFF